MENDLDLDVQGHLSRILGDILGSKKAGVILNIIIFVDIKSTV